MADIPILQVTTDGGQPLAFITGDGTNWTVEANDGNLTIELSNPTGGSLNATFIPQSTGPAGLTFANKVIAVPAGETIICGPWPPVVYNDDQDRIVVTLDAGLQARGSRI